jgi:hypothetical protein
MRFLSVLSKASIASHFFESESLARTESNIYTLKFFKYHDLCLQEHLEYPGTPR